MRIIVCAAIAVVGTHIDQARAGSAGDGWTRPPVVRLTPEQAREVYSDFQLLRRCPTVDDPYAIHEMGGNDCTGGQSGAPQQYGN